MSDIYAMQRANGDVFALDHHGRFRVPLFHSSRDAMIARSRNWEMLLFKPAFVRVALALGVRDHERAEFWRYVKRSITSNRQNFAHAVTLAAMGYHFRKLTEAYH